VFLKSEENGLLPGRVPGSGGYLGREVLVADSGRALWIQRRKDLLIIGGVELNPGPVDNTVQVSCSGCNRTQCDTCGRWEHNSCGNVKVQVAESGKWYCVSCGFERLRVLEDKVRDAQVQIEEQKRKNEALEGQLLLMGNGKDIGELDMAEVKPGGAVFSAG
jgi:hypothetical protein